MKILRAYFARETFTAVAFVLAGFLALFSFFDFVAELEDIGRGNYQFQHALAYGLLSLPNHTYELMPVVSLIGTIYALAQFASSSEFTAMRAAGMGRTRALGALLRIGLVLAIITAGIGPPGRHGRAGDRSVSLRHLDQGHRARCARRGAAAALRQHRATRCERQDGQCARL